MKRNPLNILWMHSWECRVSCFCLPRFCTTESLETVKQTRGTFMYMALNCVRLVMSTRRERAFSVKRGVGSVPTNLSSASSPQQVVLVGNSCLFRKIFKWILEYICATLSLVAWAIVRAYDPLRALSDTISKLLNLSTVGCTEGTFYSLFCFSCCRLLTSEWPNSSATMLHAAWWTHLCK